VKDDLKIGELVLVVEENLPLTKWLLARITNVSKGLDGHVRIVELNCKGKFIKRAITKICPLPCNNNN
jgi:hypothetical protein